MTSIQEKFIRSVEDTYSGALLTLRAKNADYSEPNDPWANFRHAANNAGVTIDQALMVLQGVKAARLRQLLNSGAEPQNEPILDTFDDFINYLAIHKAYHALKNTADPSYAYAGEPESEDDFYNEEYNFSAAVEADPEPEPALPPVPPEPLTPYDRLKSIFNSQKVA